MVCIEPFRTLAFTRTINLKVKINLDNENLHPSFHFPDKTACVNCDLMSVIKDSTKSNIVFLLIALKFKFFGVF